MTKKIEDETLNFNKTEDEFHSRVEAMNRELNGLKGKIEGESPKIPENVESPEKQQPDKQFIFFVVVSFLLVIAEGFSVFLRWIFSSF